MVSTDYTGRFVDLFIAQGASAAGEQELTLSLGDMRGRVTTGVQKAAQTFVILFLTEKGSSRHDPDYGTNFLFAIRRTNASQSKVRVAFREAAQDAINQQASYRRSDASDDEILDTAELVNFASQDPTMMELTVRLTTVAGEARDIVLPVTLAIR